MQCKRCKRDNPEGARFCTDCGTVLSVSSEPGVFSSYRNGWRQMWSCFWILLVILIAYYVVSLIPTVVGLVVDFYVLNFLFQLAFSFLVMIPLAYGLTFAFLEAAREESVEFSDMFEGFSNYGNAIMSGILVCIIVSIGLLLLIIPGIYFGCKLAFTPYLVVDRKMGFMEAMQESWRMTGGYALKVFLIGLLAIPICIVGFILLFVGIIPAVMWVAIAAASLYHAISSPRAAST